MYCNNKYGIVTACDWHTVAPASQAYSRLASDCAPRSILTHMVTSFRSVCVCVSCSLLLSLPLSLTTRSQASVPPGINCPLTETGQLHACAHTHILASTQTSWRYHRADLHAPCCSGMAPSSASCSVPSMEPASVAAGCCGDGGVRLLLLSRLPVHGAQACSSCADDNVYHIAASVVYVKVYHCHPLRDTQRVRERGKGRDRGTTLMLH